jgi:cyclic pyranopterin phosphate synthase
MLCATRTAASLNATAAEVTACRRGCPWRLAAAKPRGGPAPDLGFWGAVMTIAGVPLADTLARPLRDLRISVTDRCQFRCTYCMPREVFGRDFVFMPREQLLSFEELARLARIFTGLGVRKLRLTGGEPLLRRDLDKLVAMLAAIDGVQDIALTTNGALLARNAAALAAAGLRRVTVSLDSLDDAVFMALNDARFRSRGSWRRSVRRPPPGSRRSK